MPYICPAFSSNRRIRSIWRSDRSSSSLVNSKTGLCARSAMGWRSCTSSSAGFVLATAIVFLETSRAAHPITEIAPWRKSARTGLLTEPPAKSLSQNLISGRSLASSRPRCRGLRRGAVDLEDQLVGGRILEKFTGPLVQHVGINRGGFKQFDTAFPCLAFGLQAVEFRGERRDLLVNVLLGSNPMVAVVGIHPEIADQQRCRDIETKRGKDRTKTF